MAHCNNPSCTGNAKGSFASFQIGNNCTICGADVIVADLKAGAVTRAKIKSAALGAKAVISGNCPACGSTNTKKLKFGNFRNCKDCKIFYNSMTRKQVSKSELKQQIQDAKTSRDKMVKYFPTIYDNQI